jgi:hypothetical protein
MAPPLRSAAEGHAEGRDQLVRAKRALGNPVRGRLRSFVYHEKVGNVLVAQGNLTDNSIAAPGRAEASGNLGPKTLLSKRVALIGAGRRPTVWRLLSEPNSSYTRRRRKQTAPRRPPVNAVDNLVGGRQPAQLVGS